MDRIYVSISQEDIDAALSYQLPPLLFVLVRTTGTLWRISECGTVLELIAPFRSFVLPEEPLHLWREYCRTGTTVPHQFSADCRRVKEATTALTPAA